MSQTKTSLFVKEVLARLTGDNNEALAAKIARKGISAIEGQLAALRAKQVDDENTVEDAQDALNSAKYPTELPTSNQGYVENILRAQATLDAAQDNLDSTKDSIKYFSAILKEQKEEK